MARETHEDSADLAVLPDGNLILDGLPGNLRVVPNHYDGKDDFAGRWDAWHKAVVTYRAELAADLAANPTLWEIERADISRYGTEYFAAMHLTILEPRAGQHFAAGYHPFIPTPLQIRVARFLRERRAAARPDPDTGKPGYGHGVINKPREVGVTWICCADSMHGLLFDEVWDEIWMSAKEELVDGEKGTIFGKFDLMTRSMDSHLWPPKGYKEHRHRTHMKLVNPDNFNAITGTATTPDATRSTRAKQFKGDEAAFWPALKEPYVAVLGVTDTAILLSTADEKISHDFAEILDNTRGVHPEAVLDIDYREHPHFTEAWLESKDEKFAVLGSFGKDALKREIHKMGDAGVARRIYPEAAHVPKTGEPLNAAETVFIAMDPGRDDEFAITLWQERGVWKPGGEPPLTDLVWGWMDKGKDARFIASLLTGLPQTGRNGYAYEDKDLALAAIMDRLRRVEFYGCPGGDQKSPNGQTWYTQLDLDAQELSDGLTRIYVKTSHANKDRYLPGRREAMRGLIKRMRVLNHPVPLFFLRCFQQNEYQRRSRQRPGVSEAHADEHNFTSHPTATAEYLAVHRESDHAIASAMADMTRATYANPHGLVTNMPSVGSVPTLPRGW